MKLDLSPIFLIIFHMKFRCLQTTTIYLSEIFLIALIFFYTKRIPNHLMLLGHMILNTLIEAKVLINQHHFVGFLEKLFQLFLPQNLILYFKTAIQGNLRNYLHLNLLIHMIYSIPTCFKIDSLIYN